MEEKERILFVCIENTGRSQMAKAFAEKYGLDADSAGTAPLSRINPSIIEAMMEKGIDITINIPKVLTPEMINRAGLVVTMNCSVASVLPKPKLVQMQEKLINWDLTDPNGKSLPRVRKIRDEIENRVIELSKNKLSLQSSVC